MPTTAVPGDKKDAKAAADKASEKGAENYEFPPDTIITERFLDPKTNKMNSKRYLMGKFLGKGGFAKVYSITALDSRDQKQLAAKVITKAALQKARTKAKLESEIRIH